MAGQPLFISSRKSLQLLILHGAARLYALACDATLSTEAGRTRLTLSGLAENMEEALRLTERWIATARPDTAIYAQVVNDILKLRADKTRDELEIQLSLLPRWEKIGRASCRERV